MKTKTTGVSSMDQGDEGVPAAICGAAMQAQDVTKNVMSWQRMSGKTDFRYTNFQLRHGQLRHGRPSRLEM